MRKYICPPLFELEGFGFMFSQLIQVDPRKNRFFVFCFVRNHFLQRLTVQKLSILSP